MIVPQALASRTSKLLQTYATEGIIAVYFSQFTEKRPQVSLPRFFLIQQRIYYRLF